MTDLNSYFDSVSKKSKFPCSLGSLGGFVNFRNSGQRGSVKEFTLSLESVLSGLQDIRKNISVFSSMTNYDETKWRDNGSEYFTDLILHSMITVQTKPCFTTFSKIINWATDKDISKYDDERIDLNLESLNATIRKIESLALSFSPKIFQLQDRPLINTDGRGDFAYSLITFLIKNHIEKPLFECLVEKHPEQGNFNIELGDFRLTTVFKVSENELDKASLEQGEKLRFFEKPFQVDSKYYYLSNQWTDGTDSRLDIKTLKAIFHSLYSEFEIRERDNRYLLLKKNMQNTFNDVKASKPFLLLAGISGTGKTRFVREQAKTSGQFEETYCLTSVRPDWHEPSDLLGYISRLNGATEYITTDVLQFIAKAWRGIVSSGLTIEAQNTEGQGERLVVTGEAVALNQVLPYWLCLDEMNLAPVEQYFADYLSVIETREWRWDGDSFTYTSDALLKPATIKELADKGKLRNDLGFAPFEYDELWQLICQYGLTIPFNLMVAGTVNMDETTHGFSRKVIDRALSFDFGAFFPNIYEEFFSPTSCNKRLSYPIWSQASKADLANTFDADASKTVAFLTAVNSVLKNTPFELAYRALNELLIAVVSSQPKDELSLKAVWDDFMMCKVLPRIEGDSDKLTTINSSGEKKEILAELKNVLATQLTPIWLAGANEAKNQRPDLYREKAEGATDEDKVIRIPCRSKDKLTWMQQRLTSATFTSFWP